MGSEPVMLDVLGTRLTAKDKAPLVGRIIHTVQELLGHSDVSPLR